MGPGGAPARRGSSVVDRWSRLDQRRLAPARWFPARSRAGTHLAGLDLRWSKPGPPAGGSPMLRTLRVGGSEAPSGRSAPGGPPARRGSPFLPRNGEKEGRGRCPLDPGVYGPLTLGRSFWGSLSLIRSRGDFLRYAKIDLGRIFRGKICCKAFLRKKAPKSGHADGCRNSPTTGTMCPTTPKRASANERTIKEGGPGGKAPGALSSGFLRRKPGSRPESGGNPRRRSGPALVQTRTTCRQQRRSARPAGQPAPQLTGQADVL